MCLFTDLNLGEPALPHFPELIRNAFFRQYFDKFLHKIRIFIQDLKTDTELIPDRVDFQKQVSFCQAVNSLYIFRQAA